MLLIFLNCYLTPDLIRHMSKFFLLICLIVSQSVFAQKFVVTDSFDVESANRRARPGDTIILKNGNWNNSNIILTCEGNSDSSIIIKAETDGGVKLTGRSSLQIGGKYLVISGLHFSNGYSPFGEVISFTARGKLANNCRVTNTVIINYNKPKRMDDDYWVNFRGRNNRIDHCSFIDKKNMGVLIAITLDNEGSRKNHHSIDHNYFGRRLPLGSNGGEIIRVGNSQHALFYSNTQITENLFEECDGEAEVISVKSCGNLVKNNIFKKCQGSVVLRHGNDNRVEGNLFLGMKKEGTGGVRIINEDQVVFNNFFYQLRGEGFRAPLTIMNGVPNSPPTRYVPVKNAVIAHNTFVECSPMSIGEGSDAERKEIPKYVYFFDNAFYKPLGNIVYFSHDKTDSMFFNNNAVHGLDSSLPAGFEKMNFSTSSFNSIIYPTASGRAIPNSVAMDAISLKAFPVPELPEVIGTESIDHLKKLLSTQTGILWKLETVKLLPARNIVCRDGASLQKALATIYKEQVTIQLTGNIYELNQPLYINGNIRLRQTNKNSIRFKTGQMSSVFVLTGGYQLILESIKADLSGIKADHFIMTDTTGTVHHSSLICARSTFTGQKNVIPASSFIFSSKSTFQDSIIIRDCNFVNNQFTIVTANSEKDDQGIYNTEKIRLINNRIIKHAGIVLDLYRGGTDESTLGPDLVFTKNILQDCNSDQPLLKLTGIQKTNISNNQFLNSNRNKQVIYFKDKVRANHILQNNVLQSSGTMEVNEYVKQYGNK